MSVQNGPQIRHVITAHAAMHTPWLALTMVSRMQSYSKRLSCSCSTGGKFSNRMPLRASWGVRGAAAAAEGCAWEEGGAIQGRPLVPLPSPKNLHIGFTEH